MRDVPDASILPETLMARRLHRLDALSDPFLRDARSRPEAVASRAAMPVEPAAATAPATATLFGMAFRVDSAEAILRSVAAAPATAPRLITTANVDHTVVLSQDPAFRAAYAGATVRTLDGTPLVWLARLLGARAARRITGHDLLAAALSAAPAPNDRIFLIVAEEEVGTRMRALLARIGHPASAVAVTVPPFGFEHDAAFGRTLAQRIREHGTTLLVMGVGAPKSEVWVSRQGAAIGGPVVLSVGEALNVAAGLVPRAPVLMQRIGLEWLFRFLLAPRRLFRRYFLRSWRFLAIAGREIAGAVRHR